MKIRVHCDCGKKLVAAGELAGKKTKCPACGAVIRLPRLDEASAQPASFLVTETGLNLTDESVEVCAAPAEEIPPPFSVSSAEQAPDTSPGYESSWLGGSMSKRGVSDSSNTMKNRPGRELSTIPELWAAFITMVRKEWAGLRQPLPGNEDPVDLRQVRKPVTDKQSEDGRNEAWFWGWAIAGVSIFMIVGWVISNNQDGTNSYRRYSGRYERFKDDFAPGATANAVERMASMLEDFDQGSALMRSCAVSMLWLIFLALLRINATIESQTKRLLSSAEREKQPPPK